MSKLTRNGPSRRGTEVRGKRYLWRNELTKQLKTHLDDVGFMNSQSLMFLSAPLRETFLLTKAGESLAETQRRRERHGGEINND